MADITTTNGSSLGSLESHLDSNQDSGARSPGSADIHPGVGFRIKRDFPRCSHDIESMFRDFEIADISDHLNRLYAVDCAIRCLSGGDRRLVGPACTVKVYPGDNLMVHKALDLAKPGDIIVVDARGSKENAALGDTISIKAQHRGIRGFVVDGYVRDIVGIQSLNFPVYARGSMPIGPLHRGPGEINYPVCCGGVVVEPGDFIVADLGGVVVIPRESVEDLHSRLLRHKEQNSTYLSNVRLGKFSNAWVDQLLDKAGCPYD